MRKKVKNNKKNVLDVKRLSKYRDNIAIIDKKIAILFEKRMKEVAKIARYKKVNGKKVEDKKQEAIVKKRGLAAIKNKYIRLYYKDILDKLLSVSKKYQKKLI